MDSLCQIFLVFVMLFKLCLCCMSFFVCIRVQVWCMVVYLVFLIDYIFNMVFFVMVDVMENSGKKGVVIILCDFEDGFQVNEFVKCVCVYVSFLEVLMLILINDGDVIELLCGMV